MKTRGVEEPLAAGRRACQGNAPVVCANKHYLALVDCEPSRAASGPTENKLFTLAKKKNSKIALHPS